MMLRQIQHFQTIVHENSFTEYEEIQACVQEKYGFHISRKISCILTKYPAEGLEKRILICYNS